MSYKIENKNIQVDDNTEFGSTPEFDAWFERYERRRKELGLLLYVDGDDTSEREYTELELLEKKAWQYIRNDEEVPQEIKVRILELRNTPVTRKEIQERMIKRLRAEKIGANITRFTDGDEVENPYRVKALVYINRGEEIPKDLLVAMQKFDEEYKCSKTNQ